MHKEIYEHAADMFIERVLTDVPDFQEGDVRMYALSRIDECVDHPDKIIDTEEGKPQIHIKDDMAIPVGVPHHGEGKYRPYTEDDEKVYIPTVYNKETFEKNHDGRARKA